MRLDHYIKTGDNNIHMANILYALGVIVAVMFILGSVLGFSLRRDFANLKVLSNFRRNTRD